MGQASKLGRPNGLLLCPVHQLRQANQVAEASSQDGNLALRERREATQ